MIKHLTILTVFCSIALGLSMLGTLYHVIKGKFTLMGIGAICTVLFFACLVILLKEQRVARIMRQDHYDDDLDPL